MWAKHDVFGASLPPGPHLQPQLLPGLLVLAHLLPPRGEHDASVPSHLRILLFVFALQQRQRLNEIHSSQTCSNEVKCICDPDYTGKDCSVFDPIPIPTPPEGPEKYRGNHTEPFASTKSTTVQFWWFLMAAEKEKKYVTAFCLSGGSMKIKLEII